MKNQSTEGVNKTKKAEEGLICFLLVLRYLSSPVLVQQTQDWITPLAFLVLRSPACRWQIVGLLHLHYHVIQFL